MANKYLNSDGLKKLVDKLITSLNNKVPLTRKINDKELSKDIKLTASDVGADEKGSATSALKEAKSYTDTKSEEINKKYNNVENKSSATIRSEITKDNVTKALGYTPYTPTEVDNKLSALETNIDWKESVDTFDNIATKYPNPIDGWTVNVKDTDYTYRYNGTSWVTISANAIPKATNSVDGLLSKEDHTNYEDANSKKHTHGNKTVLDDISSNNVSNWNSAKTHADSSHARTDATKVEASSTNGNIKINGTETTVYTHPSGTNPHGTTKSDVGLDNVGNFKAVSTVANQGLTDKEKANARDNIGAGTSSFSGSYNDLTNKPSIPIVDSSLSSTSINPVQNNVINSALSNKLDKTTVATDSTLGLIKSGTDITVDTSGNVSVNDNSHKHKVENISDLTATADELNYVDGVTSNIQIQLDAKAPLASPTLTGTPKAPTATVGTNTTQIATTAFVQTAVSNGIAASDAMIIKGTIGENGTITELPTTYKTGWTYRVVTSGTYAGQVCEIGDLIVALVDKSGSENLDSDWCVAQTNINGAITGIKGDNDGDGDTYITTSQSGSVVTITHKDVTREDTTSTTSPSHGGTFTAVKSITSDSKGHVTGVNTETVTLPTQYSHPSYTARTGVPTENQTPAFGGTFSVSQPVSDATGHITELNSRTVKIPNTVATQSSDGLESAADKTKLDYTNIAYGTCDTEAATAEKVITISGNDNWILQKGSIIIVKFSVTNTASSVTLNVNDTGAKSIWANTTVYTGSSSQYCGYAGRNLMYVYDGTYWVWLFSGIDSNTTYSNASLGQGYGTCSTAESTTAKVVTLSSYSLVTGGIVAVKFTYAVPASATMNINSKGAKAIYYRGVAITAGVIKAGDIATFIYNGSQYHLLTIDSDANQNAFSNVVVGSTTIAADSKTDTLTLVAGDNVTITPDATNDKITISSSGDADTLDGLNSTDFYRLGVVEALSEGTDLDTLLTPGQYGTDSDAISQSILNKPESVTTKFKIDVEYATRGASSNYIRQTIRTTNNTGTYVRASKEGVFKDWKNIADGGNADALDGHDSSYFATQSEVNEIGNNTAENLFVYPFITNDSLASRSGVEITDVGDGTLIINGTSTARISIGIAQSSKGGIPLENGRYTFNSSIDGSSQSTYMVKVYAVKDNAVAYHIGVEYGNGIEFEITDDVDGISVEFVIASGTTLNNVVFKPMLEKGSVKHEFVPYNLSRKSLRNDIDDIIDGTTEVYTLPTSTSTVLGGVKTGDNITNTSGTISISKQNVIDALGYTPGTSSSEPITYELSKNNNKVVLTSSEDTTTSVDISDYNSGSATKLATARTIRTNLASTSSASFNGTSNVTPGVTGILPIANGGTGKGTLIETKQNLGIPISVTGGSATAPTNNGWFKLFEVPSNSWNAYAIRMDILPTNSINNLFEPVSMTLVLRALSDTRNTPIVYVNGGGINILKKLYVVQNPSSVTDTVEIWYKNTNAYCQIGLLIYELSSSIGGVNQLNKLILSSESTTPLDATTDGKEVFRCYDIIRDSEVVIDADTLDGLDGSSYIDSYKRGTNFTSGSITDAISTVISEITNDNISTATFVVTNAVTDRPIGNGWGIVTLHLYTGVVDVSVEYRDTWSNEIKFGIYNRSDGNLLWDDFAKITYVDSKIADLVGSAPETLDTLEELAQALKDDAEIVDAINEAIGKKANATDVTNIVNGTTTVGNADKLDGLDSTNFFRVNSCVTGGDFNDIITLGYHEVIGTTDKPLTNAPKNYTNGNFYVLVLKRASTWMKQIAWSVRNDVNGSFFVRDMSNGIWDSNWTEFTPNGFGDSATVNGHTVESDVPPDAKFTDTTIPFIVGTQTAVTGTWTGTTSEISSLVDGQTIRYWLPYNGSGNATLNLTLADGSTTGAIACYWRGTSRLTTHYIAGMVITLTYRNNVSIAGSSTKYTGWWADADSDGNTYDRTRYQQAIKCDTTAIVAKNIIVGNNGLYKHLKAGTAFDITYPILYANANISASATGTDNYLIIPFTVTTTQSITLTAYKPVFIKGNLNGNMFTPVSTTPLTQTVPTSADGYEYILLGVAYNTTAMYLLADHPIFAYKGGAFGQISSKGITDLSVSGQVVTYTRGDGTTGTITTQDTNTKATQTNTTTDEDYRVVLSASANDTTETNTLRKSTNFTANPSTGAFYATGYDRINITGKTLDIDTLTLSSGSPEIMRYIEKTDGGSANITNIPVTGKPFLLDVELIRWASTTDYVTRQTFRNANNPANEYVRFCASGKWSSWTTRVFTDTNTDTKNTAGTTDKTATKLYLAGATSQAANPVTYSNSNVYIGTDNHLYSNGKKVVGEVNITTSGTDFDTFTSTGVYHILITDGLNKPCANHGLLYVDAEVATKYQLFIPDAVNDKTYKRFWDNTNNVWKTWTTQKLTDTNTVTTATTTGSGNAVTSITASNGALTVKKDSTFLTAHPTITTSTDTTSTASPAHGGTFTAVDSVTRDSNGHVTKINTKTITLPADTNTDTKVTQTVTTNNAFYPLLLAPSGQTANTTTTSYFDSGVTLNPSTNTIAANISGNSETATKLKTARNINGVPFDGTANINTRKYSFSGSESDNMSGWYYVAYGAINVNCDTCATLSVTSTFSRHASGILHLHLRRNSDGMSSNSVITWLSRFGFNKDDVRIAFDGNNWYMYIRQTVPRWGRIMVEILSDSDRTGLISGINLVSSTAPESTEPNSHITVVDSFLKRQIITTTTDFDTFTETGVYHILYVDGANRPCDNHGTLFVDYEVGAKYQLFIPDLVGDCIYKRHWNYGTGFYENYWIKQKFFTYDTYNRNYKCSLEYDSSTAQNLVPTISTLAYWNGAYGDTSSNLTYCNQGAFGKAATYDVTDSSSASAIGTGTNLVTERDVYYGLPKINNSHAYTSDTTIYAPTTGGTSNYVLIGKGATSTPGWAAQSSLSVGKAAQLTTARTIRTNLGSTSTASFNGTANVTPGVTGTLPLANGGTGATTLDAVKKNLGIPLTIPIGCGATAPGNEGWYKILEVPVVSWRSYVFQMDIYPNNFINHSFSPVSVAIVCRAGNSNMYDPMVYVNSGDISILENFYVVQNSSSTTESFEIWYKSTKAYSEAEVVVYNYHNRGGDNNKLTDITIGTPTTAVNSVTDGKTSYKFTDIIESDLKTLHVLPYKDSSYALGSTWFAYASVCTNGVWLNKNGTAYGAHYIHTTGTTSTQGEVINALGNNLNVGTDNNSRGRARIYGTNTGYTDIMPTNNTTSNITINLPSTGGTLALTNHTHNYLPLTGGTLSGDISIERTATGTESYVKVGTGNRSGRMTSSATGKFGLYDNTKSAWVGYSDASGNYWKGNADTATKATKADTATNTEKLAYTILFKGTFTGSISSSLTSDELIDYAYVGITAKINDCVYYRIFPIGAFIEYGYDNPIGCYFHCDSYDAKVYYNQQDNTIEIGGNMTVYEIILYPYYSAGLHGAFGAMDYTSSFH